MTFSRTGNGYVRILSTLGMVLFMAFFSACEVLASEGAQSAISGGREIRDFEDQELVPLKREMEDLFTDEIQPREVALEDLRFELRNLEEDLRSSMGIAENDIWAPGGAASEAQLAFDGRYRELELLQRAIEVEQRELDASWQTLWGGGDAIDPEYQALEDLRFTTQRELERLQRFGYREIEDIWDEINELNSTQGWSNTDSQIESEQINIELQRLYDQAEEIQKGINGESNRLGELAVAAQDELNNLQNFGYDPIAQMYDEIARLEAESSAAANSANSIANQITQLKSNRSSYEINRDSELANLRETLAAIEAEASLAAATITETAISADSVARIAELEKKILSLQADADSTVAAKNSEIVELNVQITEKLDSYNLLIVDATTDLQVLSEVLLADAAAIGVQIDEFGADAEGNAEQIAELQLQKDALLAQELAEQTSTNEAITQLVFERDSGVADLQASIDSVQAAIDADPAAAIFAEIASYNAELSSLQEAVVVERVVTVTNTRSAAEVQAEIDSVEAYWSSFIGDITNQINALENELLIGSSNNATDTRIHSLKLQVAEADLAWNNKSTELSNYVQEIYRQMDVINSGNSDQLVGIEAQIEEMNDRLTDIWADESTEGLDHLRRVQELEKQARVLDEEHEQTTRRLEEELWDLEDKLSLFYKDQESGINDKSSEFESQSAALQQRRFDIEEQRFVLEQEQRAEFELIESQQREAKLQSQLLEEEKFEAIRSQIRAIELELRDFYAQQRVLENEIREAKVRIEDKKRELEDKVLDALEEASGTLEETEVSEAGLPTTIDDVFPEISEGDESLIEANN